MKKLIFLLLISILFQSCFNYKSVAFKSISNEKKQKFEIAKIDRTSVKGQLVSIDEDRIILENKGQNQIILKDEIYDVKVRKFSYLKSLRLYGIVGGIAAGIILNTLGSK
tara:strand:- start:353 stop:682 length:330 start_codon:yes stop_codon:yes gene_type:complete